MAQCWDGEWPVDSSFPLRPTRSIGLGWFGVNSGGRGLQQPGFTRSQCKLRAVAKTDEMKGWSRNNSLLTGFPGSLAPCGAAYSAAGGYCMVRTMWVGRTSDILQFHLHRAELYVVPQGSRFRVSFAGRGMFWSGVVMAWLPFHPRRLLGQRGCESSISCILGFGFLGLLVHPNFTSIGLRLKTHLQGRAGAWF